MAAVSNTTYKFKFGQNKGKTLQDAGPSYCAWLVKAKVYEGKADLEAALRNANYLQPNSDPNTPPSTPTPSRKRRAPSDYETEGSPSIRRKVGISREARRNGTMLNYDGSAYILDFGMHAGSNLQDVPRDYVEWLIDEGVPDKRPDLKSALREQGLLPTQQETPPSSQEYAQETTGWRPRSSQEYPQATTGSKPPSSQEYPQDTTDWRPPSIHATRDVRFFDRHYPTPLWISDADAALYFGLKGSVLSSRGVGLVTEADIKREAEFCELVTVTKDPKRWLYQVYTCAVKFGSVPSRRGTADRALEDFLGKNRKREEEIWDAMGFGI